MESQRTGVEDTPVEESSNLNKYWHKLFLGFLKIIPMLMAALALLNTVLSYFDIDWPSISYLSGIGLIPWVFIMMASYIFKFCEYHRMFLWYILVNNFICWIDFKWPLPISNWNYFVLHIIIAGIFLFLVLYFHQKCRKKS
jgi:hypothetical protein